jgi:hypothetical protein
MIPVKGQGSRVMLLDENSRFVRTYVDGWMDGWMDEIMKAVVGVRFWKPNMYIINIIIIFLDG